MLQKMKGLRHVLSTFVAGLVLVGPATIADGATYTVVDLTPAGFDWSMVNAVGNGVRAGTASTGALQADLSHAAVWTSGSAGSFVDLHPSLGFENSFISGADGTRHVGSGSGPGGNAPIHALMWSGNAAASAVDLHPAGATFSRASGGGGGQQAGVVGFGGAGRAALWAGTAASFVNLHPSGLFSSEAYEGDGTRQVGQTLATSTARGHAAIWSGTSASHVDLHPSGYTESAALAIDGNTQVGWGTVSGNSRALLWSGTAASAVSLHPSVYLSSSIRDAAGGWQFGSATRLVSATERPQYAMIWNGSAASAINLGELLPAGYGNSYATGMDAAGNVYGAAWVTPAGGPPGGGYRAIMWSVPEPTALALILPVAAATLFARRQGSKTKVTTAPRT